MGISCTRFCSKRTKTVAFTAYTDASERASRFGTLNRRCFSRRFGDCEVERPIHATLWQSERDFERCSFAHDDPFVGLLPPSAHILRGASLEPRGPPSLEKHNLFGVLGQKQPTKRFSLGRPTFKAVNNYHSRI